jgi:hypothetical protein
VAEPADLARGMSGSRCARRTIPRRVQAIRRAPPRSRFAAMSRGPARAGRPWPAAADTRAVAAAKAGPARPGPARLGCRMPRAAQTLPASASWSRRCHGAPAAVETRPGRQACGVPRESASLWLEAPTPSCPWPTREGERSGPTGQKLLAASAPPRPLRPGASAPQFGSAARAALPPSGSSAPPGCAKLPADPSQGLQLSSPLAAPG